MTVWLKLAFMNLYHSLNRGPMVLMVVMLLPLVISIPRDFAYAAKTEPKNASAHTSKSKKAPSKKTVKVDHNAIGFKSFQKGDFKSALKSFELAMKLDSKNAFGFLNHARTLIAINIKNDPVDYCAFESNWVMLAMASLSKAYEVNPKLITSKLKEINESSFKEFKKRPEYKKWEAIFSLPVRDENGLRSFILSRAEWITREAGMPPTTITLRSDFTANIQKPDGANADGVWKIEGGAVGIDTKLLNKRLKLKIIPFYFNEGRNFISSVVLTDNEKTIELYLGPITEDCS